MTTENPSLETGLTSVQVADRIAEGLDNKSKFRPSKTYGQILYDKYVHVLQHAQLRSGAVHRIRRFL